MRLMKNILDYNNIVDQGQDDGRWRETLQVLAVLGRGDIAQVDFMYCVLYTMRAARCMM